jgi:hypothetical protein
MADESRRSTFPNLASGALALVLVGIGVSSGWTGRGASLIEPVLRGAALLLGLLLLVRLLRSIGRRAVADARSSARDKEAVPIYQPDARWLLQRQAETAKDLADSDGDPVTAFIELLINPAEYRARTVERISFEGTAIQQHVSVEFFLPDWTHREAVAVYIPIVRPVKGELLDGFRIFGADGASLSYLSYEETVRLISVALRMLVIAACLEVRPVDPDFELRGDIREAEAFLLEIVSRRGSIDTRRARVDIQQGLALLPDIPTRRDHMRRLRKFVSALSTSYPIVAVVSLDPGPQRVLVKYERQIIPRPTTTGLKDQLRLILGLRPYQAGVPVDLALLSKSYHLQVRGPASQYLAEQYLWCENCNMLMARDWHGIAESELPSDGGCSHQASGAMQDRHYRLRRKLGQSYSHLYMRGYANSGLRNIELLVRFGETPPGTLATATLIAVVTAVLIPVSGAIDAHDLGSPDSETPALILMLPVVAASWFGFLSDSESVFRSSFLARISLISSGVLSFVAATLYLLREVAPVEPGLSWRFFGMGDVRWIALTLLAWAALLSVGVQYLQRMTYYNELLRRGGEEQAEKRIKVGWGRRRR